MRFPLYCAIVIALLVKNAPTNSKRFKRGHTDNFNVLLNIYKMNPLKRSKLYKTFSDQVLLPKRPDVRSVAMNFDSNESRKERQASTNLHLKQIEKYIHVTNPEKKVIQQQYYDIQNIDSEKFTANLILNAPAGINDIDENNFNSIFGHLESGEINDKLPVTKMVRVNNTIRNAKGVSSEIDFNEIGLNYDYEDFAKKVNSSDNSILYIFNETNVNDPVNDMGKVTNFNSEGVVVLR